MPCVITHEAGEVADLADLIDACRSDRFDGGSPDGLVAIAPTLKALGNNRRFLADLALEALKENCRSQVSANSYSPQVVLLHPPDGNFFLRANIWPSKRDPVMRTSGPSSFFYRMPHDHAFDFLTLGYLGPGYWSDYYEVEPGSVAGVPGERARLRFVERSQLDEGKMLLYRANRDIHDQLPPESLSVSINVMPLTAAQRTRQQYLFDVSTGEVLQGMTAGSAELMLRLSVRFGAGNGRDLAEQFMKTHPDPRMRISAWSALDAVIDQDDARARLAEAAIETGCPHLGRAGRRMLTTVQTGGSLARL